MEADVYFAQRAERDKLRPTLDTIARVDPRIRVMIDLRFRPAWVAAWLPHIGQTQIAKYFKGEPILPEHLDAIEDAAWRVVRAATETLMDMGRADPGVMELPGWMEVLRRVYEAGVTLDSLWRKRP